MHTCVLVADDRDIYEVLDRFARYDCREVTSESRWDFFGIGGRFANALPLKQPRQLRRFFGLLSGGITSRASIAKKYEIDQQAFLVDPPTALFFCDRLYECPLFAQGDALANWQAEFRRRFAEIPEETTLQIVDAHS
jgi:hypothetical protein